MHLMKPELRKFDRKVSCLRKCTIECFHSATKAFQSFYLHSCENGGSCVDDQFSYHCNCTDGYRGRYCEGSYDGFTSLLLIFVKQNRLSLRLSL